MFTAVVLAGDRGPEDPLVLATGAPCKALVEVAGKPMVLRVMEALKAATEVDRCILSGPPANQRGAALIHLIESGDAAWLPPGPTPSTSALTAAQAVDAARPILVTTADHALLTPEIVNEFCAASRQRGLDVTVGLCPYEVIEAAFPGIRKTVLKFQDGHYCGCNLFAFLTPEGRQIAHEWRQVERHRKNPLKVIRLLGWGSVARYFLGRLSLENALARLSKQLNLRIGAIKLSQAEAAIDVDSVSDRELVESRLASSAAR